eukprot:CAMPEP_0119289022 /NCGR_PEP_ID=MMETSP1329-20130426/38268_1 /TAXON_ID=114041 /ORGANISM="Genus nov. species nov., Strain RCC1024" /LENGTH=86 /DNA_ID=CAMNT_0007289805 /DNA_START=112 /DNA_END=368 /DNA_ORIENTATION=-
MILFGHDWNVSRVKSERAREVLQRMIEITMARGAQSGGIVTYLPSPEGPRGARSRVVNGKRTDLAQLMVDKLVRDGLFYGRAAGAG